LGAAGVGAQAAVIFQNTNTPSLSRRGDDVVDLVFSGDQSRKRSVPCTGRQLGPLVARTVEPF